MKTLLLSLALSLLVLTGCVHAPTPTVFIREVPVQVASSNSLDALRFPASYHAYTVGRRVDPANPDLMQESHVLFIRESHDRWNLHPSGTSSPLLAPAGPTDAAFVPLPLDEQVRSELQQQRRASQSLLEQTQSFQKAADVFVPAARKAVEISAQTQQRQQQLEERLRRIEEGQRWSALTNWPPSTNSNR